MQGNAIKTRIFWSIWALMPVLALAWYFGPGQDVEARTLAANHLDRARACQDAEDWEKAADAYLAAYEALPVADRDARARLSVLHSWASFMSGKTWGGIADMERILAETEDPQVARDVRYKLGTAQYFAAWKLRLEGAKSEIWKPEAEKARQHFRLLAETAQERGEAEAVAFKKNVESVVWLEQMDLAELQALPLPGGC